VNPLNIITFWLASTTSHIPPFTKLEGTFVNSPDIDSQIQIVIVLPYLAHKLDRQRISNTKTTQLSLFLLCSDFVLTPASVQPPLSQSRHNISSKDHGSFLRVSPPTEQHTLHKIHLHFNQLVSHFLTRTIGPCKSRWAHAHSVSWVTGATIARGTHPLCLHHCVWGHKVSLDLKLSIYTMPHQEQSNCIIQLEQLPTHELCHNHCIAMNTLVCSQV